MSHNYIRSNITPIARTPGEYVDSGNESKIKFPTVYSPVRNYEPTYRNMPIIDNNPPIVTSVNNLTSSLNTPKRKIFLS